MLKVFGLLINMVRVSISSSIHDSIFWNPQNPLKEVICCVCSRKYPSTIYSGDLTRAPILIEYHLFSSTILYYFANRDCL